MSASEREVILELRDCYGNRVRRRLESDMARKQREFYLRRQVRVEGLPWVGLWPGLGMASNEFCLLSAARS